MKVHFLKYLARNVAFLSQSTLKMFRLRATVMNELKYLHILLCFLANAYGADIKSSESGLRQLQNLLYVKPYNLGRTV
jgi:hypothetical protein